MRNVRVSDAARLVEEGWDDESQDAFVSYVVLRIWQVRIDSALIRGLDAGPERIAISPAVGPDGMAIDQDGELISTELLRAIPLQDARPRLRRIKVGQAIREGFIDPIPARFDGDRDFALLAEIYAQKVKQGERNPIAAMASIYGTSRHTLSARIRTARERGLLTRPTGRNLGSLTSKAEGLLKGGDSDG